MSKSFKKVKKSSIKIDVVLDDKKNETTELQRTEKWRIDRLGRWTGSQKKNLMSCSAKGGRMDWFNNEKVYFFGDTALKYIYENAMERKTGRYIDTGDGTKEMRYGTRVEPLISKSTRKILKKLGIKGNLKNVGFKVYPMIDTAGVSSDGVLFLKKEPIASAELKACTSWGTHYERTFQLLDEKGKDFWQVQSQMVAWKVDTCYYAVAEPPKDLGKYLYYDGNILDLYKDFKKECDVKVQKVAASKIHQKALLKRIMISERAIEEFLKTGKDLRIILHDSIDYFKANEHLFDIIKL